MGTFVFGCSWQLMLPAATWNFAAQPAHSFLPAKATSISGAAPQLSLAQVLLYLVKSWRFSLAAAMLLPPRSEVKRCVCHRAKPRQAHDDDDDDRQRRAA